MYDIMNPEEQTTWNHTKNKNKNKTGDTENPDIIKLNRKIEQINKRKKYATALATHPPLNNIYEEPFETCGGAKEDGNEDANDTCKNDEPEYETDDEPENDEKRGDDFFVFPTPIEGDTESILAEKMFISQIKEGLINNDTTSDIWNWLNSLKNFLGYLNDGPKWLGEQTVNINYGLIKFLNDFEDNHYSDDDLRKEATILLDYEWSILVYWLVAARVAKKWYFLIAYRGRPGEYQPEKTTETTVLKGGGMNLSTLTEFGNKFGKLSNNPGFTDIAGLASQVIPEGTDGTVEPTTDKPAAPSPVSERPANDLNRIILDPTTYASHTAIKELLEFLFHPLLVTTQTVDAVLLGDHNWSAPAWVKLIKYNETKTLNTLKRLIILIGAVIVACYASPPLIGKILEGNEFTFTWFATFVIFTYIAFRLIKFILIKPETMEKTATLLMRSMGKFSFLAYAVIFFALSILVGFLSIYIGASLIIVYFWAYSMFSVSIVNMMEKMRKENEMKTNKSIPAEIQKMKKYYIPYKLSDIQQDFISDINSFPEGQCDDKPLIEKFWTWFVSVFKSALRTNLIVFICFLIGIIGNSWISFKMVSIKYMLGVICGFMILFSIAILVKVKN